MTYVLYGDNGSGAFCVEAALAEAGAPYEFQNVSLDAEEQRSSKFLAINPSGKVPALKLPSGEILTETAALLLVIAERHPGAALLPATGTTDRAQAYRWIAFMASEIYPMVEICDYPTRFVPQGETADALRRKARDRVRERILVVEHAAAGPWMLQSGFSVADIYAAMFSRWRECREDDWREANLPKICAIAAALAERKTTSAVWNKHFPAG
jgi:GST-like protein